MTHLGANISRFERPDDTPPEFTQCDYMDAIDRQAALGEIDGLKIVRHRLQQAASAARSRVDDGDAMAEQIEATLEWLEIDSRIAKLEEETA